MTVQVNTDRQKQPNNTSRTMVVISSMAFTSPLVQEVVVICGGEVGIRAGLAAQRLVGADQLQAV